MKLTFSGTFLLLCSVTISAAFFYRTFKHIDDDTTVENVASTTICMILSDDVYDTRTVSTLDSYSLIASGAALDKACDCPTLCYEYPYFQRAGIRCKCLEFTQTKNEEVPSQRELLPSNFFDGDDLSTCPSTSSCDLSRRCPSRQECVKNATVCSCVPVKCSNRYGNPCGPASVCRDTPTGYNCTKLSNKGCAAGCGPNSTCTAQITANAQTEFGCQCDAGFARTQPYLGCVPIIPAPVSPPMIASKAPVPASRAPVSAPKSLVVAPKAPVVAPKAPVSAPKALVVAPKAPTSVPVTGPASFPGPTPVSPVAFPVGPAKFRLSRGEDLKYHRHPKDFNLTNYTVCINILNRQFSLMITNHKVVLGRRGVPIITSLTASTICIEAKTENLDDGPNPVELVSMDSTGTIHSFKDRLWFGSLQQNFRVLDLSATAVEGVLFSVTLAEDPKVHTMVVTNSNGGDLAVIQSPGYSFFITAYASNGGLTGITRLNGSILPAISYFYVRLLPPPIPSTIDNNDLSRGTTEGWTPFPSFFDIEIGIASHFGNTLRTDKDIYVCDNGIGSAGLSRAVLVPAGSTKAEVRFRFATNANLDSHGYHVWLLAQDANAQGNEFFKVGSKASLIKDGDPFDLVDFDLMSSLWQTSTLNMIANATSAELRITISGPVNQPNHRSCLHVDYLKFL